MKIRAIILFSSVLFYTTPVVIFGQNAPVTALGYTCNALPGMVTIPVMVSNFSNIGAISLCFDYSYGSLHYTNATPNPLLTGFAIGDQDLGNGKHRVTMGWFGPGISFADGTVIMTVNFTYMAGNPTLDFYDNGPSCEYADANYNVLNDIPQSSFYLNGAVCGYLNSPGPISGMSSVCQGEEGVTYTVDPIANASGYTWTFPAGVTIVSGANTNGVTVNYSLSATSGLVTVNGFNTCCNGPASQLPVAVNSLPLANAGQDITIPYGTSTNLTAMAGGSGAFLYHWMPESLVVNPNQQSTPTVNLTSTTVFTLNVTNQVTQCLNSDDVVVTLSGGPLIVNPGANPAAMCRGTTSQLFANAGGGSGNYSYTWTCTPPGNPPWSSNVANPVISPDSTRDYNLSVSDGFSSAQGAIQVNVFQLPTAVITGGDTLCGEGLSAVLPVQLTGTPPWSLYYSNGILTWFVQGVMSSPYYITATDPGMYSVLAMSDAHCTGVTSGSSFVGVYPIPPTPVISVNGTELFSTGCCGNQWYFEGQSLPGASGQVYQPVKTGHYFDIVTVEGCPSDTSNIIYYIMTGYTGIETGNQFIVEPNPSRDYVTIRDRSGSAEIQGVCIISMRGEKEVINPPADKGKRGDLTIDISSFPAGIYILQILTGTYCSLVKVVVL